MTTHRRVFIFLIFTVLLQPGNHGPEGGAIGGSESESLD